MQQAQELAQRPADGGTGFLGRGRILAGQDRLGELQVPVAEAAPGEVIERVGRVVEAVGFERRLQVLEGPRDLKDLEAAFGSISSSP